MSQYNYSEPKKKSITINGEICDHITVASEKPAYTKLQIIRGKIRAHKLERGYYIPRSEQKKIKKIRKYVKKETFTQ